MGMALAIKAVSREIHLLQGDELVTPVTEPEWTGQEGANDCDLKVAGPSLGML